MAMGTLSFVQAWAHRWTGRRDAAVPADPDFCRSPAGLALLLRPPVPMRTTIRLSTRLTSSSITAVVAGLLARNLKRRVLQSRLAEQEVRALSERLINVQEEERARLARELHDDISQQVAALSIGMSNLKRQIPQQQGDAREQSDRIQQKLVHVAESIRRLSHELHPAVLEYSGLAAALRTYCSEFKLLTGIRVSLQADGSFESVPSPVAVCIYRITQEALQNVAKHAKVAEAEVELIRSDATLCLSVSDHGPGIKPSCGATPVGLGLASIRERTRLVNGTFEIQSKPEQGTTVLLRIPA
jgi:signal transduction histidine kinase